MKKKKPRTFYLALFTNCIKEKSGHVYYKRSDCGVFKYPNLEIVKVCEVSPKKRKR